MEAPLLDRAKQLQILVVSYGRCLDEVDLQLEALEGGDAQRTAYSTLARAFSTMKHDARHLRLTKLAGLAEAAQTIVERAQENRLGLPLDALRQATAELRRVAEALRRGRTHQLDPKVLKAIQGLARAAPT